MNQPRLLADFAAVPTPRERRHARATNRAAQLDMFANDDEHQADTPSCPVCAGEHLEHDCKHGSAPALPLTLEHKGSRAMPARTLHLCQDPTCPIRGTDVDRRDGGHYHDQENHDMTHTSTSAQRDENRLTADDLERISANVRTFAVATPAMNAAERITTAERIAHRAIGCDERDLRDSELTAIREMVAPILAAHPSASPSS